jgi:hypothetical protein
MHKLKLLTISMIAAGSMVAMQGMAAPAASGSPAADLSAAPSGSDINSAAITQQLQRNLAYTNAQNYQPDNDLGSALVNTQRTLQSDQNAYAAQDKIVNSSSAFSQQVLNANKYETVNGNQVFAQNTDSPSGYLAAYEKNSSSFGANPNYSYMDLINSDTVYNSANDMAPKIDVNTCIYGLAGQDNSNLNSTPSMTANVNSGSAVIPCLYNPQLTQAINYIHMLAGYGSKMNSDYSGNVSKLKSMNQTDMDNYKDMIQNTVTARSAGEDALYDVMQGNIAVNGHSSVNAANSKRYSYRANSTDWQQHIASDSTATVLRQQAYMMAEIEKELSQLIDLQRKQYALSAINEMQMANLAMQMKSQSITGKMQAAGATQSVVSQGNTGNS